MNRCYLQFALAWLVSAGVGCTSAPIRYYTLTAPPDKTMPASETPLAIDVRVVHTPPQLNRAELMVRTGPTEVMLLENERWTSPVRDEIKDALRLELQRRSGPMSGLHPAWTKLTLDIDVKHFEAELGRYALLDVSWRAALSATGEPSAGTRAATCTFQAGENIHAGYTGMVEGYQREIAALAESIVAALMSPADSIDARCQTSIEGSAGGSGSKNH
ncbi:MAG TPA: PqiC family protein [Steroidobacteraceae bacterium]|nr:PqiC family protein [Steroidobacteraceae bacterium]